MKQIIVVLIIIATWTVSGYAIGLAFEIQVQCAFLGLAICAALLWSVSRDEEAWQRLTGGEYDQRQPARYAALFLIAIPPVLLFVVLLWWVTGVYRSG